MAKAPLSEVPLTGPLASSLPSTQISMLEPRLMPATWCQAPLKTSLVEVTLPPAPPSKENIAFVELAVPRPYWWTGPAAALVSQFAFVVEEELTKASMEKSPERRLRFVAAGRSIQPPVKVPPWPTLPAVWVTLTTEVASLPLTTSLPGVPATAKE